jgi:nucleotide-binding universal stress UspA family protein
MAKHGEINPTSSARAGTEEATPFHRMLVAIDGSPVAHAALQLVAEWAGGPGADVRVVRVTEERRQRGRPGESPVDATSLEPARHIMVSAPSLGARNRQMVHSIAEAAADFGADVIVLGFDRPRLASHRLARSLRQQIVRATDAPVLVAPSPQSDGMAQRGQASAEPPEPKDEERVTNERRYAHV